MMLLYNICLETLQPCKKPADLLQYIVDFICRGVVKFISITGSRDPWKLQVKAK